MPPRPRSKKNNGLPDNLTQDRNSYRYRNPVTGKLIYLGADREAAIDAAVRANDYYSSGNDLLGKIKGSTGLTIRTGVDEYIERVLPHKPWDTDTVRNNLSRLKVYQREFGARAIAATDRLWLAEWLEKNSRTNEVYNRHRERLIDLWAYFISRGYATTNEAEATLKRSMSKKLEGNQKVRKRLELEGFWTIYNHADCPGWLQVAMELSLVTLQARKEIVVMQYHDIRNGYLHVIRDKTAADTDMAFIRIAVDDTLAGIVAKSRQDGLVSPFMVHHKPIRKRKAYIENKAHWTRVQDDYLSRAFSALRDKTGLWDSLKPPERPTFHEIRSLGARTYMKAGYDKSYVQALMTHTTPKTTDVYLSGGEITDDMYQTVTAGLIIKNPGL